MAKHSKLATSTGLLLACCFLDADVSAQEKNKAGPQKSVEPVAEESKVVPRELSRSEIKAKEHAASVLTAAEMLTGRFNAMTDPKTLKAEHRKIEAAWQAFRKLYGTKHDLSAQFALLRARSASASRANKKIAEVWRTAIQLQPIGMSGSRRLGLFTEAANATTDAKDYRSAERFFAAARSMASVRGENADKARLYLRIHELRTTGQAMEWRRLNDNLKDLRRFSEAFVMWSIPRLDALLGEAEIRLSFQPNDGSDKRNVLGDLKARIELAQKGMNGAVPPVQLARIRSLFYALEDHFQL
ncbi:MAG: hypothetical protein COB37_01270 [Kordiimonadales bacterium]|nr:MAG: hypothetical protein COB37_01270 [Kordiimonadales bacterium]